MQCHAMFEPHNAYAVKALLVEIKACCGPRLLVTELASTEQPDSLLLLHSAEPLPMAIYHDLLSVQLRNLQQVTGMLCLRAIANGKK